MAKNALLCKTKPEENGAIAPPPEEWLQKKCPTIYLLLTASEIDGQEVDHCYITFSRGVGCWEIRLSDPENRRSITLPCPTLLEGFESLEALKEANEVPWYYWDRGGSKKKRKK